MKAIVCNSFAPVTQLMVADLPEPQAGPGQVLIDVVAAGVNFLDTLIVQGTYQLRPAFPFAPGSEVSGIVRKVGPGVSELSEGQRVVAFTGYGGFAARVVADAGVVFPISDSVSYADAAAFLISYATSHHALQRCAHLRPGELLLVLGASGGVGLTAVELGKRMGATVMAGASSDEKLALCRRYGADHLIDYSRDDLRTQIKEITHGAGVNVVYDPVGGRLTEPALRSLSFRGRFLVVGFAAGDIPKIPLNLLLLKAASAIGVSWGAFAQKCPQESAVDVKELLQWLDEGALRPHVSGVYPFEQCVEALELIVQRRVTGKSVVIIDPSRATS
jgi:NADPH:quinone reductase